MLSLPQDATIDGEAVVCDGAGVADFERLHSREHDRRVFLYAFDLLELDGVDLRPLPSSSARISCRSCCSAARAASSTGAVSPQA